MLIDARGVDLNHFRVTLEARDQVHSRVQLLRRPAKVNSAHLGLHQSGHYMITVSPAATRGAGAASIEAAAAGSTLRNATNGAIGVNPAPTICMYRTPIIGCR
jgi:hypothetical protein